MIWTFLPSNVAGRTKKTVTSTVVFVAYCVGNAVGAQMLVPSDAPKYLRGLTACGAMYVLEFISIVCWRLYCTYSIPSSFVAPFWVSTVHDTNNLSDVWENRRRAKIIAERGISAEEAERLGKLNAEADMTDRENIFFKYTT